MSNLPLLAARPLFPRGPEGGVGTHSMQTTEIFLFAPGKWSQKRHSAAEWTPPPLPAAFKGIINYIQSQIKCHHKDEGLAVPLSSSSPLKSTT
ncbi:hypothetical protein scyTo_0005549 [Scyliorhinus torazame]|uniref:Uncharacterized protein n=1 Tax=Scyliorhinus torazame TaxID=75743 RepID=A0A401P9N3_SCYTO|nr:hypothetical protein [Scyliorhinus torazame]